MNPSGVKFFSSVSSKLARATPLSQVWMRLPWHLMTIVFQSSHLKLSWPRMVNSFPVSLPLSLVNFPG